jgi:hypothetical protein
MSIQKALIQTRGDVFAAALLVEVMASAVIRGNPLTSPSIRNSAQRVEVHTKLRELYIQTFNAFVSLLPEYGIEEINVLRASGVYNNTRVRAQIDDLVAKFEQVHNQWKLTNLRLQTAADDNFLAEVDKRDQVCNSLIWLIAYYYPLLGRNNADLFKLNTEKVLYRPSQRNWADSDTRTELDSYLDEAKRIVQEPASDGPFADMPPSDDDSPGGADSDDASSSGADSSKSSSGSGSSGGVDSEMAQGGSSTPAWGDVPFGDSLVLNRTIEYNLNIISTKVGDDIYYEGPEGVFWQDIGGTWTSTSDEPDEGSKLRLGYRDDDEEPFFVFKDSEIEITVVPLPTLNPEIEEQLNGRLALNELSPRGEFVIDVYGDLYINDEGGWEYVVNPSELDGDRELLYLTIRNGEVQISTEVEDVEIRGELELRELYNLHAWRKEYPNNLLAYVDEAGQTWIVENEIWASTNVPLDPAVYEIVRHGVDTQWGHILESGPEHWFVYAEVPKLTLSTLAKIKDHIAGNSSYLVGKYVFFDGDDYYEDDEAGNWHYVYQVEPGRTELYAQWLSGESEGSSSDDSLSSDHESPAVGTSSDDSLSSASTLSELPGVGTSSDDSLPLDDSKGKPPVRIDLMGETGVTLEQTALQEELSSFIQESVAIDDGFKNSSFYYEEKNVGFHLKTPGGDWRIEKTKPDFAFKIVKDRKVYRFESIFENNEKIDRQKPSQKLETVKVLLRNFGPLTVSEEKNPLSRQLLEEYFGAPLIEGDVYRVGKVKNPPPFPRLSRHFRPLTFFLVFSNLQNSYC